MQTLISDRQDYDVRASFRQTFGGAIPTLKVTRLSDKRVIYPFNGCADMPLYSDRDEAVRFAQHYGKQLVEGDIAHPE